MDKRLSNTPQIPGYRIEGVLGIGASATVYLATQVNLQRQVALKILSPHLTQQIQICERFEREARDTAAASGHPNVMTIHDLGQHQDHYYMALQFLPGLTLRDHIELGVSIVELEKWLYQLASALIHIHRNDLVHRDIKPANILFDAKRQAILGDFGLAQSSTHLEVLSSPTFANENTATKIRPKVAGTSKYMSPEQARGEACDTRSDLFSLGAVFNEALRTSTDSVPRGSGVLSNTQTCLNPRRGAAHDTPYTRCHQARLQAIIDNLIAHEPDERYQTAESLCRALNNRSVRGQSIRANNTSTKAFDTSRSKYRINREKPVNKRARVAALASSTALVAIVLATYLAQAIHRNAAQSQTLSASASFTTICHPMTELNESQRDALIELAQLHRRVGRLFYPPGSNAWEAYTKAYELDACNPHINEALKQLRAESTPNV